MPKVLVAIFWLEIALMGSVVMTGLDYFGMVGLICLIPFFLAVSFMNIKFILRFRYRPAENHLGVIYRFGRFSRFVEPDEWTFLLPIFDKVHREVSLYMRTAELLLKKVELRDGLAVDVKIKVFFRTDLRLTSVENRMQTLKFEGPEWPEMVKTSTEDVVRNQVFLDSTYTELMGQRKNREIKQRISSEIAARVRSFGIIINENHGAMLVNAQPNNTYFEAVQVSRAAAPLGEAALERLKPVLSALNEIKHEDARTALLLELASKIVEVDNLPEIVLSPAEDYVKSEPREKRKKLLNGTEIYSRQKQTVQGRYPFAE